MNPDQWQQIRPILESALELTPASRKTFLDGVCADPSLRQEIDSLLLSHDQADANLLNPGSLSLDSENEVRFRLLPGKRIGPYEILEEIAQGGMGAVYRAIRADGQYKQEVALKIVRADLAADLTAARFRNERQILASLDHPNIAKILDGGTTADGLPYFVMELIEGLPVTEYCDRKKLSIDSRLEIFRTVCSAVHYAHQHLVIHRDIKPTNILVTAEALPKLLDFGIAKILGPNLLQDATLTAPGLWLMTPEYASPEQLRGGTITTATDVYSIGVVLYQLLTGHRAFRFASRLPHDVARTIFESDPEKPSTAVRRTEQIGNDGQGTAPATVTPELVSSLRATSPEKLQRRLAGDLDNIVTKAIRKEPGERYNSVDRLSEDLRRHLEGLPVSARKATVAYRASKFISRHKLGVASAAITVVAVLAGFGATLHEAHVARTQRARAEARFNDVRALANSLMFDVHDSIQDLPGSTPARKLLVERALRYLDSLSHDAASDASLQRELATAYEKVGTVQGNPFGANLGDTQGALDSYRKSLAIFERLTKANPRNVDDEVALARVQGFMADIISNRLGPDGLKEAEQALATAERILQVAPANQAALSQVRREQGLVALILQSSVGDYQEALSHWQKKLSMEDDLVRATPNDRHMRDVRALTELYVASDSGRLGSRKEVLPYFQPPNLATDSELAAMGVEAKRINAWARAQRGDILLMEGEVNGALESYQEELRIAEPLTSADPANSVLDYDLATAYANLGNALVLTRQQGRGLAALNRAVNMFEKQIAHDPAYVEPRWAGGRTRLWISDALARTGDRTRALESYQGQLADWETMARYYPLARAVLAEVHEKTGSILMQAGKPEQASQEYQRALEILGPMAATHPNTLEASYVLADTYSGLGDISRLLASDSSRPVAQRIQDWNEARTCYSRSREAWQKVHNPGAKTPAGFACGNPKSVGEKLAKCDATLSRLESR